MQNYPNLQVDLFNCDKEPIHIIGQIQPCGFLLVLNAETLLIEQASQNTGEFLGYAPEELLGQAFAVLLKEEEASITAKSLLEAGPQNPQLLMLNGRQIIAFCHLSDGKIILEGEHYLPYSDEEKLAHNRVLTQLHERLNTLGSLTQVAEAVAEVLLEVLQYDRVNITQFDADWHSDVIAESRTQRLPSFVGHHFPATDIPAPARELLRQKHIRQIPDVNAVAVGITPYFNPTTGVPTNILQSEFRNPSDMHLEYVRNTGVAATISFSIMVKDQLWGVVACHHSEPAYIDVWRRQLCDLIVKTLANVIASIQERRDMEQYNRFKEVEEVLVNHLCDNHNIQEALFKLQPCLLDITEGSGAALLLDGVLTTCGQTPSGKQIESLVRWLSGQKKNVFYTHQLSKEWPEAAEYQEMASGVLALEISRFNLEYLLFFKPEIKENRIWAGNPEKPVQEAGMRMHPRKSFEQWVEVVKGKSLPWGMNELEVAEHLLKDLVAIRLRNQTDRLESLNQELHDTTEQLLSKNNQLEDFARILAHNLRSPLANVVGLYQYYAGAPSEDSAALALHHIKQVADNMLQTIQDLNNILRTQMLKDLPEEKVSLAEFVEKERQNLEAVIAESRAEIRTDLQVPFVTAPRPYVESILHNFISNALKYRSPDRNPEVQVKSWVENNQLHLAVSDNGVGMDLQQVGDNLFGLYKTFHRNQDAKGLGLYLTKMQVNALGGEILVQSAPDQGTTFTIVFSPGAHLPADLPQGLQEKTTA
ncbi:ATP-binding protein [Rufibacter roseus]|uniref:histidine kinase n=1 Tax=Rufibacter roseus TaxID=1567108 RepID=A0ABW2DID6_9BACT|nr:ATP-binding protein [Rufibacter roseus]